MAGSAGLLVGRDPEMEQLVNWVADVAVGRGRAVLVEGEVGIGKSTLVAAACAEATRQRCRVLWGAADEFGQDFALLPLMDAIRGVSASSFAEIRALLRDSAEAAVAGTDGVAAASERVLAFVDKQCAAGPVVLVVDDLHWADQAAIAVWARLARSVEQMPLLLIGTARPAPGRDAVAALRGAVGKAGRIRLSGLTEPATVELVGALCGARPGEALLRLAAGASGNPLYLVELVDALTHSGGITIKDGIADVDRDEPRTLGTASVVRSLRSLGSLAEVIGDRLRFLSPDVRETLSAAALLGAEFHVTDLAVIRGRSVTDLVPAIREAQAVGILVDAGAAMAFRHPLVCAALYGDLPEAVRKAWHLDAAQALARSGAGPERVARQLIPADFSEVPGGGWVLTWLADNAAALVAQAPHAAATLLERGLHVRGGAALTAVLSCRLAEALLRIGDLERAEALARRALDETNDAELTVELCETLTYCMSRSGRAADAIELLASIQRRPSLDAAHGNRLRILSARQWVAEGALDTAQKEATESLAAAGSDDRWVAGWALMTLADIRSTRGAPDALEYFDRALGVVERDPTLGGLRLLTLANKADELLSLDRGDEAHQIAVEVGRSAEATGHRLRLAQAQAIIGVVLYYRGEWDDLMAEIEAVGPAQYFSHEAYMRGIAALVALHRNHPNDARRHLAAANAHVERVRAAVTSLHLAAELLQADHDGTPDRALPLITTGLAIDQDDVGGVEDWLAEAVRLALACGDVAIADRATERAQRIGALGDVPHRRAVAAHCRGLLERSADLLVEAGARYHEAGWALPRAQAIGAAALVYAENGASAAARARYAEAADAFAELGATWELSRLRSMVRRYGIHRGQVGARRRPSHGWRSLTPTETTIAGLVAQGMSNTQIAEQLFLSRRTVQTHVSHVLHKLDLHSRVDIAVAALRNALPGQ